jgi:hypothetical protein
MGVVVDHCPTCGAEATGAGWCQDCQITRLVATTLASMFPPPRARPPSIGAPLVIAIVAATLAATCSFILAIGLWFA